MAEPAEPLGIYVVRGSAAQLEQFHAEIAKDWKGGEFLGRLSSKTEYRYWAYPTRTAREARTFMFGSMEHGLRFDIEEYEEATYYAKEHALLNEIVSSCQITSDPFEILPNRILRLRADAALRSEQAKCVSAHLKKTDLGSEMTIEPIDVEARSERG